MKHTIFTIVFCLCFNAAFADNHVSPINGQKFSGLWEGEFTWLDSDEIEKLRLQDVTPPIAYLSSLSSWPPQGMRNCM